MSVRISRLYGSIIVLIGCVVGTIFLADAASSSDPLYWVFQSYPVVVSVALVVVGIILARGQLVPERFLPRLLVWTGVSLVVFSMFIVWFFGFGVLFHGQEMLDPPIALLTFLSLSILVGVLIGTYDSRVVQGREAVAQLSRINETLRITTGELVTQPDRDALEHAVCNRLVDSESFDAAWVGRYDPDDGVVRPAAWTGFDDVDGNVVPVDTTDGGVWSRAIRTTDGVLVQTVAEEDTLGRWESTLERHGVESMAVVPIIKSAGVAGLLGICAGQPDAFDDRQLEVLVELGETVGHAIDSLQAHDELEARERELVAQNERLDEFAGVVSHDLRNPLNVILGRVPMLRERSDSDDIDAIERSGRRMEEIITDLLSMSRASRTMVSLEPVPLATAAAESWRTVETNGVEFDLDVSESTTMQADPVRLRTLFENLFRNAIEHNDAPLTVRVGVIETTGNGDLLAGFFVEDDGVGIPEDARDDVFDHGFTTNTDGTGFGLSIVHGVADAHGWDIELCAGRDGGTRIEITGVESANTA